MRNYLIGFLREFEYDAADAAHLLGVYDTIAQSEEASALLSEALAAYAADRMLDYKEEILKRSQKIAKLVSVHPYTTDLLVFMCMTRHLKTLYEARGLDLQIYRDSVLDLKWKTDECKLVKGICGSFVASWFPGFFRLERFALGRLQFELITARADYEKDGVRVEKDKDRVINVHIPRTGTPIDKESCDRAYAQARAFFRDEVGERCPFVCHSWLLYPKNKELLSPHSNTYRFMSEYEIIASGDNLGEDLWRLFDTDEKHPDRLPADTSFRRAYAEHLKKGGRVGWGLGVKL
ncbi:MAG: hypothetical protein J6B77_02290 [Clostridia bacterium]|nr:hypothetical protein [Clostridia bacterium]